MPQRNNKFGIKRRPRILICVTVPETLATILKNQPKFLANYFDVRLASAPDAFFRESVNDEGVQLHEVRMVRGISLVKDALAVLSMVRLLLTLRPQLVHSYTPKAGLVSMLGAWLCRVPIRVHTFTGLIFPTARGPKQKLLVVVDKLICACATHIVPEGNGVKKDLVQYGVTSKPLHVIGYGNISGVDTSIFAPDASGVPELAAELRSQLGIAQSEFVFCFVGRLNKDKGITELLRAFAAMPSGHLILVGRRDSAAPVHAEVLASIHAQGRVHAVGFLHDVRPALRAADVLVLPSYREGFPNVLLQAGAMALPAIATDINGCNEIIEEDVNGWLVPPRDAPALQEAMHRAMRLPAGVRRAIGTAARIRIQERFEQHQHWQRLLDFYNNLIGAQTVERREDR